MFFIVSGISTAAFAFVELHQQSLRNNITSQRNIIVISVPALLFWVGHWILLFASLSKDPDVERRMIMLMMFSKTFTFSVDHLFIPRLLHAFITSSLLASQQSLQLTSPCLILSSSLLAYCNAYIITLPHIYARSFMMCTAYFLLLPLLPSQLQTPTYQLLSWLQKTESSSFHHL